MAAYKVLVVDDSAFMRKIIADLIMEDSQFIVIDSAKNGKEAVEKAIALRPDVITMDIEMPEMNGLESIKRIMRQCPIPIVMLSSVADESTRETVLGLEWGAVDFVKKPSGSISLDLYKVKDLLLEKLKIAANTRVSRLTALHVDEMDSKAPPGLAGDRDAGAAFRDIVAIGTSTGGPRALHTVLAALPGHFPAPILVVQHMPPQFTKSLAERLDHHSSVRVVEARENDLLTAGTAYIAPGGWHMKVTKANADYRIQLTKEEPRSGHRPSVDMLFESLVPLSGLDRHLVLMTGMGSDGAKGMKAALEAGAKTTIAESEETCIVFGMPRAAIELKSAMHVLPLDQIPQKMIELICSI